MALRLAGYEKHLGSFANAGSQDPSLESEGEGSGEGPGNLYF